LPRPLLFLSMHPRLPRSTLFPYTTLFRSLIINVMFNLTRIAEKHNQDDLTVSKRTSKKLGLIFAFSFPFVFGLLVGGDYLTSKRSEEHTSELQSRENLVCRLLLEKKKDTR